MNNRFQKVTSGFLLTAAGCFAAALIWYGFYWLDGASLFGRALFLPVWMTNPAVTVVAFLCGNLLAVAASGLFIVVKIRRLPFQKNAAVWCLAVFDLLCLIGSGVLIFWMEIRENIIFL